MRILGLDLDPIRPFAWDRSASVDSSQTVTAAQFPPALVRPSVRGAPLELDWRWPARSEGTGLDLDVEPRSQRAPIAFAWRDLASEEGARLEFGDSPESGRSILVSEALGLAGVALGLDGATPDSDLELALVVPNAIHEGEQEGLLRGMRRELRRRRRSNARECLIWRPVAAALQWLEHYGKSVSWTKDQVDASVGKLLHLHLAIEGCEATWLDLVPYKGESGQVVLLPGRPRPLPGDVCLHPMLDVVANVSAASLADIEPNAMVRSRMAWHAAWLSPLLREVTAGGGAKGAPRLDPLVPTDGMAADLLQRLRWLYGTGMEASATGVPQAIKTWLAGMASEAPRHCAGVVVTGCLANWANVEGAPLGIAALRWMRVSSAVPPLVQPVDGASILAQGAAIFAERRRRGVEAYLDSLPAVELRCMQDGEPAWVNLMDFGQRWAVGGRVTRFQVDKASFSLPKGQDHLAMTVHREGYRTCRHVRAAFGFRLRQTMPVRLRIEVDPGQGNPRVELAPDNPKLLRGETLTLDWGTAKDTGKDRETELKDTPRGYPPPLYRTASKKRWLEAEFYKEGYEACKGVSGLVWHFLSRPSHHCDVERVKYVASHIIRAESGSVQSGSSGAAVSSDGVLADGVAGQKILDQLARHAAKQLRDPDDAVVACGLRFLAALSDADVASRELMLERLMDPGEVMKNRTIRGPLLSAVGSCLRDPAEFTRFFDCFDAAVLNAPDKVASWQLAECLRQICRYRKDALAGVSTARVERWLKWLFKQLASEPMWDRVRPIHARATEAIVYLLRKRRYDRACLEVDGELHLMGDAVLEKRITTVSCNQTEGLKLALAAMEMVRQYMVWSGSGDIVVGSDDDANP